MSASMSVDKSVHSRALLDVVEVVFKGDLIAAQAHWGTESIGYREG